MKKLLPLALIIMAACNNSSTNTEPTPATTNVQNANGNIPDTTNGVNLNADLPKDSSKLKDSTRR
ncbi:MAG TPA: hypothetical protein VNR87_02985 [Flavisolibacter sp.]|nr:hypothetical protein [Flavisolibacter sp.]